MSTHRERADELKRRVVDEAGLGRAHPNVSPEIARLVDLWAELHGCVLELELRATGLDARVEREGSS